MSAASEKAARVAKVNHLVRVISTYGRRFFYNARHNRVAEMVIGKGGHLYFIDDYTGKPIYVAYDGRWSGWSHGGTLRDLVKALAEYVRTGNQLSISWIGPERFDDSNIWGYAESEMAKCRAAALTTGVIRQPQTASEGSQP
jgi:hypothetical protein